MSNQRQYLGKLGESIAERHLKRCGYRVLDRNFRTKHGELDLVAFDDPYLVFLEVKTRMLKSPAHFNSVWGCMHEAVGPSKQERLRWLASAWLSGPLRTRRHHLASAKLRRLPFAEEPAVRFDVVAILMSPVEEVLRFDHIRHAFS